jgi:hypothetical protein
MKINLSGKLLELTQQTRNSSLTGLNFEDKDGNEISLNINTKTLDRLIEVRELKAKLEGMWSALEWAIDHAEYYHDQMVDSKEKQEYDFKKMSLEMRKKYL